MLTSKYNVHNRHCLRILKIFYLCIRFKPLDLALTRISAGSSKMWWHAKSRLLFTY